MFSIDCINTTFYNLIGIQKSRNLLRISPVRITIHTPVNTLLVPGAQRPNMFRVSDKEDSKLVVVIGDTSLRTEHTTPLYNIA